MTRDAVISVALDHHKAGRLIEADRFYRGLLSIDPTDADALHLSGVVALAQGNPARALDLILRALAIHERPAYQLSLSGALMANGRPDEAALAIEAAVAGGMDQPQTRETQAAIYVSLHRWADAEAASREAVVTHPNPALSWRHLGVALQHQARIDEAANAFAQSLLVVPGDPDALAGLGNALRGLDRLHESETALRQVLASRPADPTAINNLALTREALGHHTEALDLMDEAFRLDPENPAVRYNRALMLLRSGRMAEAWPELAARMVLDPNDQTYVRYAALPRWTGEPLEGRTILLTHEQGAGDTIQFIRYATLVTRAGGQVVLDVQPALHRLFTTLSGTPAIIAPDHDLTGIADLHCPLMSLPHLLGTTLETIPASIPYVAATPHAIEHWATRIDTGRPGLRVGLVWAGNPHHPGDRMRSIPFAAIAPLLAVPGTRWFSLQVGHRAADAAGLNSIEDLSPGLTDFSETAAAMANLDLVIAVDTSSAHLAGALGRPTWLLLPLNADWRWLSGLDTSPWYPTMRLFRQDESRSWQPVLDRIATELTTLASREGETHPP